jgi:hypothetical protein
MNVFELRKRLIDDYRAYVKSFISIADPRIRIHVDKELDENELLWPQARIGLNPAFAEASELERRWLKLLNDRNHRLPSEAGKLFEAAHTRPDFFYKDQKAAVYIDGPPHDHADRQARDAQQQRAMEDLGYIVLRFRHDEEWEALLKKYPSVFGTGS